MVKIVKIFGYIVFFVLSLIYFIPKLSVYYFVEKELKKQEIILSKEELLENIFSLELNHPEFSYKGIESAKAQSINMNFFLVYNVISAKNIEFSDIASSFIPLKVDNAQVQYTIFDPLNISLKASGEFGELDSNINVLDKNVTMKLIPSELMLESYKRTLKKLNKNENGEYTYAKTF